MRATETIGVSDATSLAVVVPLRGRFKFFSGRRRDVPGNAYREHSKARLGLISVVVFLGFWEFVVATGLVNPLFCSSPTRILGTYGHLWQVGLANDIAVSGKEFVIGFALSLLVGIPLGILMGWFKPVEALLDPVVTVFNATPTVALTPLLIISLGIGIQSKIAIVFVGAVIAILINTAAGVRTLDPTLLKAARSFGASNLQIFRTIALPGSVPYIATGMRLALGQALIGIVVGELYGASAGSAT